MMKITWQIFILATYMVHVIKVTSKKKDSSADLKLSSSMYTKNRYGQYDRITWDNHIVKSSSSGNADGTGFHIN